MEKDSDDDETVSEDDDDNSNSNEPMSISNDDDSICDSDDSIEVKLTNKHKNNSNNNTKNTKDNDEINLIPWKKHIIELNTPTVNAIMLDEFNSRSNPREQHYLYLMKSCIITRGQPNIISHVGRSRNPLRRIQQHNRLIHGGAPSTRQGAPNWILCMSFPVNTHVRELWALWDKKSRGIVSREIFGCRLAIILNKKVASLDEKRTQRIIDCIFNEK
jgi:hypothetical protein